MNQLLVTGLALGRAFDTCQACNFDLSWVIRYPSTLLWADRIMLTPEITSIVVEHPASQGPYGAKGVGEICTIPTPPAITNAIYNAVGVRIDHLPVDQELIARAVRQRA